MKNDSLTYDSIVSRPLPKWLIEQKEGLNTIQPREIEMKDDKSIYISFAFTIGFVILVVGILSLFYVRKYKK